jgi:hypothetical protein
MMAVGCLFPILFLAIGGFLGGWLGGRTAMFWGGGIGLVLGLGLLATMFYALIAARKAR